MSTQHHLITYRCEACRGLFTTRRLTVVRPRYCPGCEAERARLARAARVRRPSPRRHGVTPALHRPARGNPRKG